MELSMTRLVKTGDAVDAKINNRVQVTVKRRQGAKGRSGDGNGYIPDG
jgi:hypothetical protein